MPRKRSPSKPRSKSVTSAGRKRGASKGRKSTPSRKASPAKKRSPSKSPARKTGKSPAAKKTPAKTPGKSPVTGRARSRSTSRGRKPATTPKEQPRGRSRSRSKSRAKPESKATTIATKIEKKVAAPITQALSGTRQRLRSAISAGTESARRLTASEAAAHSLRTRSTSAASRGGRKGGGIVQTVVALPKRAWNAVRIPNAGRRLKRHAKNNWKKYLVVLVLFVTLSVAYHFSRELKRSIEQLRTQVADFVEEQKKVFGVQ